MNTNTFFQYPYSAIINEYHEHEICIPIRFLITPIRLKPTSDQAPVAVGSSVQLPLDPLKAGHVCYRHSGILELSHAYGAVGPQSPRIYIRSS